MSPAAVAAAAPARRVSGEFSALIVAPRRLSASGAERSADRSLLRHQFAARRRAVLLQAVANHREGAPRRAVLHSRRSAGFGEPTRSASTSRIHRWWTGRRPQDSYLRLAADPIAPVGAGWHRRDRCRSGMWIACRLDRWSVASKALRLARTQGTGPSSFKLAVGDQTRETSRPRGVTRSEPRRACGGSSLGRSPGNGRARARSLQTARGAGQAQRDGARAVHARLRDPG